MTTKVNDEVLGRFARQQHDLFERVRKGAVDPEMIYHAVSPLLKQGRKVKKEKTFPTSIIRRLSTPNLTIQATDGRRTLAKAMDVFVDGIYGESCDVAGNSRPATTAVVYELIEDGIFQQIFKGQGVPFDQLCWEQDQIIEFAIAHREHLHPKGCATFFPFKSAGTFFVANVYWDDARRLKGLVHRLAYKDVWGADYRFRVVLPASPELQRGEPATNAQAS
jgi:hypothetical protein